MNCLIPCAGKSSRYETSLPKYLLSMPDGTLMFELAARPFLDAAKRVCFAVLREHDEEFHAGSIISELIPQSEIMVLDEVTRGEAETVQKMLEHFDIDSAFLVKDSDSFFRSIGDYDPEHNFVSVCSARDVRDVKLYNKSFALINDQGYIVGMLEKEIYSEFFSCGGYFFSDPSAFREFFHRHEQVQSGGEFYLSNIIDLMIGDGVVFHPMRCTDYRDWGTHEEWIAYRRSVATFFIDIDGVLYENGSRFWQPRWGENRVFEQVRKKVNDLYNQGNYIVLVTSRPEDLREVTQKQLAGDDVHYHQLVMAVHHGARVLVNDFSPSNPYPSATAINVPRDSGDLASML